MSKVLFHIGWIIVTSFLVAFVGIDIMPNTVTKACSGEHGGLGQNPPFYGCPVRPLTAKWAGMIEYDNKSDLDVTSFSAQKF